MQVKDSDDDSGEEKGKSEVKDGGIYKRLIEYQPGAKDQSHNKDAFRQNYGVEVRVPSVYVLDAKIYPTDPNYIIKVV